MQTGRGLPSMSSMQPRSTPSTSNPSAYSSPRNVPISLANTGSLNVPNYHSNSQSAPPAVNNGNIHHPNNTSANNNNSLSHHQSIADSQQHLAHPLPQPPNPASSIAKWGTPAHLPPKPPPPKDMNPQKFIEINRGLPPHAAIPGLPRGVFTGGAVNGNGLSGGTTSGEAGN